MGMPGRSYALTIASQMGLDGEIIGDAEALLSPVHQQAENPLQEIQEERYLAEERHKEAEEALANAQKKNVELDEQLTSILDSQAEMMEEARHQLQQRVEDIAGVSAGRSERWRSLRLSPAGPNAVCPKAGSERSAKGGGRNTAGAEIHGLSATSKQARELVERYPVRGPGVPAGRAAAGGSDNAPRRPRHGGGPARYYPCPVPDLPAA